MQQRVYVGFTHGRWTVIAPSDADHPQHTFCHCTCGVEKWVNTRNLASGKTKSCGCYRRERMAKLGGRKPQHGQSGTLTHNSWRAMVARCHVPTNISFKYYGGRGITVCDRWRGPDGFELFWADMGDRPSGKTLDRIDVDGNYEPSNCRWATDKEQRANRRPAARLRGIVATIAIIVLALPAVASAHMAHALEHAGAAASYGYDLGAHAKHTQRTRKTVATPTTNPIPDPTRPSYGQPTNTGVRYLEAGDEGACANNINPVPFLQAHDATAMRFGVQPSFLTTDEGVQCVDMARTAGYKIYLTIAFNASAPAAQVAAYVAQAISVYGPAWAISFGNEETLTNNWVPNPVSETADAYYTMWQAVEPTIAADDPGAIRVLADASPWDAGWLERLVSDHPTGAMAAAFHCYNSNAGGLQDVPQLAAAMATAGLPLWCSEMAPQTIEPTGSAAGAFVTQTVGQYDAQVAQAAAASPDLAMVSFYEWPSIGAVTPGIAS